MTLYTFATWVAQIVLSLGSLAAIALLIHHYINSSK